jgi:hypothetical protein
VGLAPEEHSAAEEGWEPGADAGPGVEADDGDEDPEGERIAAEADIGKPPERQTVVVEQCCAWGGEQRLRLRLTLCVGAGVRTARGQRAGAVACVLSEPDPWRLSPCRISCLAGSGLYRSGAWVCVRGCLRAACRRPACARPAVMRRPRACAPTRSKPPALMRGGLPAADDAELDVEVLRIALFREGWQCLAEVRARAAPFMRIMI